MSSLHRATLVRAAEILEREVGGIVTGFVVDGKWPDDLADWEIELKEECEEMERIAKEIRAFADEEEVGS